jgi:hypothetical protein
MVNRVPAARQREKCRLVRAGAVRAAANCPHFLPDLSQAVESPPRQL